VDKRLEGPLQKAIDFFEDPQRFSLRGLCDLASLREFVYFFVQSIALLKITGHL